MNLELANMFKAKALELGATFAEFTQFARPLSIDIYADWLANEQHASMEYLHRHLPIKASPRSKWPKMQSAFVLLIPYNYQSQDTFFEEARIAMYAKNKDYHIEFKERFQPLLDLFAINFSDESFLLCTDSAPILERDLAYKAGAGWFGKNSCLLNRSGGSLFLIAEILTSLEFKNENKVVADFCGNCTRCIDACPTQAINNNRTLNAGKCISYWTIESKEIAPKQLRDNFNDWLFGCDICQTVCPWNEKAFDKEALRKLSLPKLSHSTKLVKELQWILEVSEDDFRKTFKDSPILRAKSFGLKRNALTVIANKKITELTESVKLLSKDAKLGQLAIETLQQLT